MRPGGAGESEIGPGSIQSRFPTGNGRDAARYVSNGSSSARSVTSSCRTFVAVSAPPAARAAPASR